MSEIIEKPRAIQDIYLVLASMLYPINPVKQELWIEATQHYDYIRRLKRGEIAENLIHDMGKDWMARVNEFPKEAVLRREADYAAEGGIIAGDMLLHVFMMDLYGIKEPSLRKAVFIIRSRVRKYRHRNKSPQPHQKINLIFTQYRSVSHLWGAIRMNDYYGLIANPLGDIEDFEILLSIAKTLQDFAISYIPLRAREPLVSKNQFLLISDEIAQGCLTGPLKKEAYEKFLEKYKQSN